MPRPLPPLSENDIERFWSYVDKNGPIPQHNPALGQCWLWTGARSPRGYGAMVLYPPTTTVRANRVAYAIQHGEDPFPLLVLHHCDNPPCIRGEHIRKGTTQDNSDDAVARDRMPSGDRNSSRLHPELLPRGEDHHYCSVPDNDIAEMRRLYAEGGWTVTALAKQFKISISTAAKHIKGEGRLTAGGPTQQKSLVVRGDNHHMTKATFEIRQAIRIDRATGMTFAQLSAKYGLTNCPLSRIIARTD